MWVTVRCCKCGLGNKLSTKAVHHNNEQFYMANSRRTPMHHRGIIRFRISHIWYINCGILEILPKSRYTHWHRWSGCMKNAPSPKEQLSLQPVGTRHAFQGRRNVNSPPLSLKPELCITSILGKNVVFELRASHPTLRPSPPRRIKRSSECFRTVGLKETQMVNGSGG